MTCLCGARVSENRRHCAFCRRTIALIRDARCVSCAGRIHPGDSERVEGLCAECRSRHVPLGAATRRLLRQAARARYRARA